MLCTTAPRLVTSVIVPCLLCVHHPAHCPQTANSRQCQTGGDACAAAGSCGSGGWAAGHSAWTITIQRLRCSIPNSPAGCAGGVRHVVHTATRQRASQRRCKRLRHDPHRILHRLRSPDGGDVKLSTRWHTMARRAWLQPRLLLLMAACAVLSGAQEGPQGEWRPASCAVHAAPYASRLRPPAPAHRPWGATFEHLAAHVRGAPGPAGWPLSRRHRPPPPLAPSRTHMRRAWPAFPHLGMLGRMPWLRQGRCTAGPQCMRHRGMRTALSRPTLSTTCMRAACSAISGPACSPAGLA